nr:MAG TPA: hypothetical protein [Caudoviricetes sp.]
MDFPRLRKEDLRFRPAVLCCWAFLFRRENSFRNSPRIA